MPIMPPHPFPRREHLSNIVQQVKQNGAALTLRVPGFVRYESRFHESGAAYRTRTCDPRITNAMLYQLS